MNINRLLLAKERCNRLEGDAEIDILTVGYTALDAAAVVCPCHDATLSVWLEDVVLLTASAACTGKSEPIFKALHGIDAQHGSS